MREPHRWRNG